MSRPRNWCKKCGGPLKGGRCENCATLAERNAQDAAFFAELETALSQWVALYTSLRPGVPPLYSLLETLLPPKSDPTREVRLPRGLPVRIEVLVQGSIERSLEVPKEAAVLVRAFFLGRSNTRRVEQNLWASGEAARKIGDFYFHQNDTAVCVRRLSSGESP